MTIAVTLRTGSAVVFAADSKITTQGVVGYEQDGKPRWQEQTYDNATKLVHDRSGTLMAMSAGHANIGRVAATDFISTLPSFVSGESIADQEELLSKLVEELVKLKKDYWETTQVDPKDWPGPTLLLAASSPGEDFPKIWRVELDGPDAKIEGILTDPGIRLEGSYDEVFTLLYGLDFNLVNEILGQLGIERDRFYETYRNRRVLVPIDKINFWVMPLQDAIDMAFFLATVQVEMDRFLPGTPACGGPIDVMVLRMAPRPEILSYPGKVLHHPKEQG